MGIILTALRKILKQANAIKPERLKQSKTKKDKMCFPDTNLAAMP